MTDYKLTREQEGRFHRDMSQIDPEIYVNALSVIHWRDEVTEKLNDVIDRVNYLCKEYTQKEQE